MKLTIEAWIILRLLRLAIKYHGPNHRDITETILYMMNTYGYSSTYKGIDALRAEDKEDKQ